MDVLLTTAHTSIDPLITRLRKIAEAILLPPTDPKRVCEASTGRNDIRDKEYHSKAPPTHVSDPEQVSLEGHRSDFAIFLQNQGLPVLASCKRCHLFVLDIGLLTLILLLVHGGRRPVVFDQGAERSSSCHEFLRHQLSIPATRVH